MFRRLIAILLLISMFVQTFDRAFIVADYYLQRVAFLKKCKNKYKPLLQCKGKCVLAKKLQQQKREEEQQQQHPLKESKQLTLSSKSFYCIQLSPQRISTKHYPVYVCAPTTHFPRAVFHPPPFSA